ncbi:MAG: hypothetical protein K5Q68_12795 [Roseococcus sp.]|nr:hypothetical protein [Roseococcus sp.]
MIELILKFIGCYVIADWIMKALHYGQGNFPVFTETLVVVALFGWLALFAWWVGA